MTKIVRDYKWVFDGHTFGQHVSAARKQAGLSQAELAEMFGYTSGWVSQIERGVTLSAIQQKQFLGLCNLLDLDPREYMVIERGAK